MKDTLNYLHQILAYDPETGFFTRKVNQGKAKHGDAAGMIRRDGYLYIGYGGKRTVAQRLAWLMTHGEFPKGQIDHINGARNDNRIANLRDVSHSGNQQNRFGPQRNNTTGFLGVTKTPYGKFHANIKLNGKTKFIGSFENPESAYQAYLSAKRGMHATCTL